MKFWLDGMLPPRLCGPIREWTGYETSHIGTQYPEDRQVFDAARASQAVVITKDQDFVSLVERLGSPPQVIWLTCGNCSNPELERILQAALPDALELLQRGEALVEITGALRRPGSPS